MVLYIVAEFLRRVSNKAPGITTHSILTKKYQSTEQILLLQGSCQGMGEVGLKAVVDRY